jgi:hypothetical protein
MISNNETLAVIALIMTIADIKRTELVQNEREILAADTERWQRMGAGAHLNDWLAYYDGLAIRRRLAMKIAHTNAPIGQRYSEAYSQLMRDDGFDTSDKSAMSAFTAVLWLGDNPERMTILREILSAMTPGQRARLNSPISARQRVDAVLKARTRGKEETIKESPVAMLKRQIAERDRKIAELEAKFARGGESLFDLKQDSAADIGRAQADNISETKFDAICKAAKARYREKAKARQTPAG